MGTFVIWVVMACAVVGAIASIFDEKEGVGREFLEGLHAIGHIFVPVAGIMASVPYLARAVSAVVGPMFAAIGADPAIAATSLIATDMGGYQLALALAGSREGWMMAMVTGYMAGATIVFSIPVGLSMLEERDHKYMALGVMSGILTVPLGVLVATLLMAVLRPSIRTAVATSGPATVALAPAMGTVLANLVPLVLFVSALALGLRFAPDAMIRGFMRFGRAMDIAIRLVLVASIVEYFTGACTWVLGSWGFDPIIADAKDQVRALEVAGYIGLMLSGAFPMVYLIRHALARPIGWLGEKIGLEPTGAAGILAAAANILAMFRLVREMRARDKVMNIAFAVSSAFLLGDHLAFTANFQPELVFPVMAGKLTGGLAGLFLATRLSVPKALELEAREAASPPAGNG
jgi:ethanolamine transporter